ncbi:MAG: metalloregulator ArsR/SmtB family transcription factor [Streptosporangiales bacterium]|nr:metalloregulator ArsR/SmtB family transcription factor [Streptosporangiales bacterium]
MPILPEPPLAADARLPANRRAPLPREEAERIARELKAVSDPTRLQLLSLIQASPAGEACVCDLTAPLDLTQPTVSHHLKILVDAGLLTRDKRGIWAWYAIAPERLEGITALLNGRRPRAAALDDG